MKEIRRRGRKMRRRDDNWHIDEEWLASGALVRGEEGWSLRHKIDRRKERRKMIEEFDDKPSEIGS